MKLIKKLEHTVENWWFYLSEEDKRVLRFTGTIMLQFLAFVAMMILIVFIPYCLILIANYYNLPL